MVWFRILGAAMMTLGAALVIATFTLAAIVIANFAEWSNAADALTTIGMITLPAALLGVLLIVVGRMVYGQWLDRAPLRRIAALVIQSIGALITLALGVMFVVLIMAGVGPQDRSDAASIGLGMLAGLALLFFGVWLKPSGSGRSPDLS